PADTPAPAAAPSAPTAVVEPPAVLVPLLAPALTPQPQKSDGAEKAAGGLSRSKIDQARRTIQAVVMSRIDLAVAVSLPRKELVRQLEDLVGELLHERRLQLNRPEQQDLVYQLVNEMMGLGPLEPLLEDDTVTDIMINGPRQIYIERYGKLELTAVS